MSWTLIEHQALTSSVASVTLGSGGTIPQTYKTLKLVVSARTDRAYSVDILNIKPNNATTNFTVRQVYGSGSAAASANYANNAVGFIDGNTATSSTFGSMTVDFPNYASTTVAKPYSADSVNENNATESYQGLDAVLWNSTSAITSLVFTPNVGTNFLSGSTFTLYGLA